MGSGKRKTQTLALQSLLGPSHYKEVTIHSYADCLKKKRNLGQFNKTEKRYFGTSEKETGQKLRRMSSEELPPPIEGLPPKINHFCHLLLQKVT